MFHRRTIYLALAAALFFGSGLVARPFVSQWVWRVRSASGLVRAVEDPPDDTTHYARRSDYYAGLGKTKAIVFLGDSRIELGEWAEMLGRCDISNRGLSGDTTGSLLRRVRASVPTDNVICVLQAGVNDLRRGLPIDAVLANYRQILEYLRNERRARVILTPVIFVSRDRPALNGVIAECNRGLQELASSTGAEWLDMNAVLCPQGYLSAEYTLDGMHLNARGYEQVCRALLPDLSAKITD